MTPNLREPGSRAWPDRPDSCNLTHETSPFRFQIDFENSILALDAGAGLREVPSYSLKRTRAGMPLQAVISFSALRVLPARAA